MYFTLSDVSWEAILARSESRKVKGGAPCQGPVGLDNPSQIHCEEQHHYSTNTVDPLELWPLDEADLVLITLATKHGKDS